jgi:hypothetical protein
LFREEIYYCHFSSSDPEDIAPGGALLRHIRQLKPMISRPASHSPYKVLNKVELKVSSLASLRDPAIQFGRWFIGRNRLPLFGFEHLFEDVVGLTAKVVAS